MVKIKTISEHLHELKTTLSIEKYTSHLNYLSDPDKEEIKKYIVLSLELFNKLKDDGFHKLESRHPILKNNSNIDLDIYLDRDERKIRKDSQSDL